MSRAPGLAEDARREALHDAALAAQAVREGALVAMRNVGDLTAFSSSTQDGSAFQRT